MLTLRSRAVRAASTAALICGSAHCRDERVGPRADTAPAARMAPATAPVAAPAQADGGAPRWTGPLGEPVVRTTGPIAGRLAPDRGRYHVGEPIFVTLAITNTGASRLAFAVGGDRTGAPVPLRHPWVVRDARGDVVCD